MLNPHLSMMHLHVENIFWWILPHTSDNTTQIIASSSFYTRSFTWGQADKVNPLQDEPSKKESNNYLEQPWCKNNIVSMLQPFKLAPLIKRKVFSCIIVSVKIPKDRKKISLLKCQYFFTIKLYQNEIKNI